MASLSAPLPQTVARSQTRLRTSSSGRDTPLSSCSGRKFLNTSRITSLSSTSAGLGPQQNSSFSQSHTPTRSRVIESQYGASLLSTSDSLSRRRKSRLLAVDRDNSGRTAYDDKESESPSSLNADRSENKKGSSADSGTDSDIPSRMPKAQKQLSSRNPKPPPQKPSVLQVLWRWFCSFFRPWLMVQMVTQLIFFLGILKLNGIIVGPRPNYATRVQQVQYSEFLQKVSQNKVQRVVVDSYTISWEPKYGRWEKKPTVSPDGATVVQDKLAFTTTRPPDMPTPYEKLLANGVEFGTPDRRSGNKVITVMLTMLYIAIILGIVGRLPFPFLKAFSTGTGTGRQIKKSGKGSGSEAIVKFSDVAGVDEAKEELQEVVEYLRTPEKFTRLGARPPTGVLLVGAPGTGKTLLAKAVAGEADVPFISVSASEFVELYVGMGAARVRDVFTKAKAQAPAIVFIDELDAVGKGRSGGRFQGVASDEREQTLNQLLTELDGFETQKLVICLAATNRPDTLDSALRRPGRFDRIVSVERPDKQGRKEILDVHIKNRAMPLAPDVDLDALSTTTVGFTGAELANLVNEAALLAGRRSLDIVDQAAFEEAVMRVVGGVEKKRSLLNPEEKNVIANHEVGHALVGSAVAQIVKTCPKVTKLSIMSRSGGALGYTLFPPNDTVLMFADDVAGRLTMLMGGRAAEEVACGRVSSGAKDDIQSATDLAYQAIAELGLSTEVGPVSLQALADGKGGGDMVGALREKGGVMSVEAETEVKQLLAKALSTAKDILKLNKNLMKELSEHLQEEETLQGPELDKFLARVAVPDSLRGFISSTTVTTSSS